MKEKLVLIDGHSILNRAFYGVPDFTNSKGQHTNAVFGFLNIMFKILEEEKPEYMAVAFDVHQPTFRHEMFPEYKGTRKPMLPELREQVPLIKELLVKMGVRVIELPGYEADDVIGTLSKRGESEGLEVSVISGDRDLLQLATHNIKIRIPKTKKGTTEVEDYTDKEVVEKYKVTPIEFIDVKALMGDSSDNIPGVPGIGEKTATTLIAEYGSIENAYKNIDTIKNNRARENLRENYNMAQMSKVLATININSPVECNIKTDAVLGNIYTSEALVMIKDLEFKSMLSRFENADVTNDCENKFYYIDDFATASDILSDASDAKLTGFHIVEDTEEHILGVSLAFDDSAYFIAIAGFITEEFLKAEVKKLGMGTVKISMFDVKRYEPWLDISSRGRKNLSLDVCDLGIGAYLINPLKDTYDYDDIARDFLNMTVPSYSEIMGKCDIRTALEDNPENLTKWACYEAYVALNATSAIENRLKEEGMFELYQNIELPLAYVLYDMEQNGVKLKKAELEEYGKKLSAGIKETLDYIYKEVGEEFNVNSPKKLGEILFDKMHLPGAKKTKTGYSTSADVLEKLKYDYPFVAKILEYRQLTKLKSTYADGLAQYIKEDGRIHGKFNQTITATGRISSTEPNLQNIPIRMELGREIRKVFVPEDGFVFIDADYSQIELRVLAHISNDETLIEAYNMDMDIHRITASKVFHTPLDEVTDNQRRNAKAVNFGIVYGISSFGLGQDLSISKKEAQNYIDEYFITYPNIKRFLDRTVEQAKSDGYVTTMFGRKRPIPELSSGNFMQRSFGERIAMNSPIQGTAADIMKIAMVNVERALKEQQLQSRIVLQVHDELLIEAKEEELDAVKNILEQGMKKAAILRVPLEIDMKVGYSWYEAH
ncbi:MAG: DNA polymerase I [Eubacterium sp.]